MSCMCMYATVQTSNTFVLNDYACNFVVVGNEKLMEEELKQAEVRLLHGKDKAVHTVSRLRALIIFFIKVS